MLTTEDDACTTQNLGLSKNGVILGHLNIQGLRSKFDEIHFLLNSNKIDIFGVTETNLTESQTTECFAINGFQ